MVDPYHVIWSYRKSAFVAVILASFIATVFFRDLIKQYRAISYIAWPIDFIRGTEIPSNVRV